MRVPLSGFAASTGSNDSPLLWAVVRLNTLVSLGTSSLLVAVYVAIGCALAGLVAFGLRARVAFGATIVFLVAASVAATSADLSNVRLSRAQFVSPNPTWIDDARVGNVTAVATPLATPGLLTEQLYWNRSIAHEVVLTGADRPTRSRRRSGEGCRRRNARHAGRDRRERRSSSSSSERRHASSRQRSSARRRALRSGSRRALHDSACSKPAATTTAGSGLRRRHGVAKAGEATSRRAHLRRHAAVRVQADHPHVRRAEGDDQAWSRDALPVLHRRQRALEEHVQGPSAVPPRLQAGLREADDTPVRRGCLCHSTAGS